MQQNAKFDAIIAMKFAVCLWVMRPLFDILVLKQALKMRLAMNNMRCYQFTKFERVHLRFVKFSGCAGADLPKKVEPVIRLCSQSKS